MKVYVVRHGQTEWNILKKMQGSKDIPLNDKGIEQAYITKSNLENIKFDLIIVSPLIRAKQTAEIISKDRSCKTILENRIKERDYGEFEGVQKSDFSYLDFWSYTQNNKYEYGENIQLFFKRIYDFLDELKEKYKNKDILIVTHGGVTKAIECYFNGMMKDEDIALYLPDNCEIKEYELKNEANRNRF